MNKRKYLDDLEVPLEDRPENYCDNDDPREEDWKKEREIYGFDQRETWGLDSTFYMWLYERLMMYNEVNNVDTEFHKFIYKDEELSLQDCIDRMLKGLKLELKKENFYKDPVDEIKDILPLFTLCHRAIWW